MSVVVPFGEHQCALRWSLSGDPDEMICTLGMQSDGVTPHSAQEAAEAVYNAAIAAGSIAGPGAMIAPWTFVGVTAYQASLEGTVVYEMTLPVSFTAGSQLSLPQNCAALVRKKTLASGRRNVGRMFLPAGYLNETSVTPAGVIADADYASLGNRLGVFYGQLVLEDLHPVLFHSDGEPSTEISAFVLDRVIATQRRRLR